MKKAWHSTPLGVVLVAACGLQVGLWVSRDEIHQLSNAAAYGLSGLVLLAGTVFLGVFLAGEEALT